MKLYYKITDDNARLSIKEIEELFYQTMNDYIAYTKTLRYRMRMKKKPIRGKEVLNRLNKK